MAVLDTSIVFIDDNAVIVTDLLSHPMKRPIGLDPHMFVVQGTRDGRMIEMLIKDGSPLAALGFEAGALEKFNQGRAWDAQRIGGRFHSEFVDYATVVIGLYAASAAIPRDDILAIQNRFAQAESRYRAGTLMNRNYSNLPERNVVNTDLGYSLYESKRIRVPAGS